MESPMTDIDANPLISAAGLKTLAESARPPFLIDARFRLEDPAYGRLEYDREHISGAFYLHLDEDMSSLVIPGETGRHPLPDPALLEARLRSLGLRHDDIVVAYDDGPGFYASRAWWLLRWLGHTKVLVLDGGLAAWRRAGLPLTGEVKIRAWPGDFIARPEMDMVLNAAAIESNLNSGRFTLLDARAPERFRGEIEPIDPIAGHIPGAFCLPCAGNLNAAGEFLSALELRDRFPQGGDLVCYCGSGVTACHNILAAVIAGLPMPRLYPGSWSEWITDIRRPIAGAH